MPPDHGAHLKIFAPSFYSAAAVALAVLFNGLTILPVVGQAADGRVPPAVATATNSLTMEVRGYQVEGNTLLPRQPIYDALAEYTGPALSLERVREAALNLQLTYRRLGYATVAVSLPRQQLTNGIVRIEVTEGRLADIIVTGNRYYSSNNVRRALPGLTTNIFLNTKWLQPELDAANASLDRQIYPVVGPGPEPGTTELTLKVKDRLPLHGHLEINNRATPDTPALRVDGAVQYNNFWQLDHQLGLQFNFTPERAKLDVGSFYDGPLIASYSGYYRIPLGHGANLVEDYAARPVDFGYDQVTHRFSLPPQTGSPELVVYASHSTAERPVRLGPLQLITATTNQVVVNQTAERDLTWNENLGLRFTLPVRAFSGVQSAFNAGLDYKSYQLRNFSTNLSNVTLYGDDGFGNPVLVTNTVVAQAFNGVNSVYYIPLGYGWSATRPDRRGSTAFSFSQSIFLAALAAPDGRIQSVAGSRQAGGNFSTVNLSLSREQRLPHDWSLLLRANGQWASEPLISQEQFALGGSASVRGYQEGEEYGDSGWRTSAELRAPATSVDLPMPEGLLTVHLRGAGFVDYGERYLIDPGASRASTIRMLGTGVSLLASVGLHFEARATMACALLETPGTSAGEVRVYFTVGTQF